MTKPIETILPSVEHGIKEGLFCPHLKRYKPNPFLMEYYYCSNPKSSKSHGDEPCLFEEWLRCLFCLPITTNETKTKSENGSPRKKKRKGIFGLIDDILGVPGGS